MSRTKTYFTSFLMILIALSILLVIDIDENNISGYFTLIDAAPEGFFFEEPEKEPNAETASLAIQDMKKVIESMQEDNLTTSFSEDALYEAEQSYDDGDYLNVLRLSQLTSFVKKEKLIFLDKIELINRKEAQLKKERIDTSKGISTLSEAIVAFNADQLDEARTLLKQADDELDQAKREHSRIKDIARLGRNFVLRYWWQILIILTVLGVSLKPAFKKVRKKRITKKLIKLRQELVKTKEMIKKLQKACFVEKKMTTSTYKNKVAKSEERIAAIKHTIPVLEAQLKGKKVEKKKTKGIIEVKK